MRESRKSLRRESKKLRNGNGCQLLMTHGLRLLKPLEQPGVDVEHTGRGYPGSVSTDRLGAVLPVVVVAFITDDASQARNNRTGQALASSRFGLR